MVEARDGKTRQQVLHIAGEILTVLPLELLSGRRQRIVIEYRGDVSIEIMDGYLNRVDKLMIQNEIKKLKIELKNETDANKKIKILDKIAELKKAN